MTRLFIAPETGDDLNDGLSESAPLATRAKAESLQGVGDRISTKRGTSSVESAPVTPEAGTTWDTYGIGDRPILRTTGGHCFHVNVKSGVTIEDQDLQSDEGHGVRVEEGSDGLVVNRTIAHDCVLTGTLGSGYSVRLSAGHTAEFDRCEAKDNENDGFQGFNNGTMTVRRSKASGHVTNANSDGATTHEDCAMKLYDTELTGNNFGVHHVSNDADNIIDGCKIWGNVHHEVAIIPEDGSLALGSTQMVNTVIHSAASIGSNLGGGVLVADGGKITGGHNTIVCAVTSGVNTGACYRFQAGAIVDIIGDILIADPDSALSLLLATDSAITTINFADIDYSYIASNPNRIVVDPFTALLSVDVPTWLSIPGASPGGRQFASAGDNFSIGAATFHASTLQLPAGHFSEGVNATAAFTTKDYAGRDRIAGAYSRGAFEPAQSAGIVDLTGSAKRYFDIEGIA